MAATRADNEWGKGRSWWIVWTFIPGLSWVSFLYAGFKAKKTRWKLFGLLYFIGFAVLGSSNNVPDYHVFAFWVIPIVHAFRIRKEYLTRLRTLQGSRPNQNAATPNQNAATPNQYTAEGTKVAGTSIPYPVQSRMQEAETLGPEYARVPSSPPIPRPDETQNIHRGLPAIDLNKSSEEELAQLPGIGIVLGKRAISLRKLRGPFDSVEDFGIRLNIRPDTVERIRPLVSVSRPQQPPGPSGRIVDY